MSWIYLLIEGIFEVVWATTMRTIPLRVDTFIISSVNPKGYCTQSFLFYCSFLASISDNLNDALYINDSASLKRFNNSS